MLPNWMNRNGTKRKAAASPSRSDDESSLPDSTAPGKLEQMLLNMEQRMVSTLKEVKEAFSVDLATQLQAERAARRALEDQMTDIMREIAALKAARSPEGLSDGPQHPTPRTTYATAANTAAASAPTTAPSSPDELRQKRLIIRNMANADTGSAEAAKTALAAAIHGLPDAAPYTAAAKAAQIEFASPRNGLVLVQCTTPAGRDAVLRAAQGITASTGWRMREDLPLAVRQQRQAHNADHQALRDAGLFPRWRLGDLWYKTATGALTRLDYERDTVQQVIAANTAATPEEPQGPLGTQAPTGSPPAPAPAAPTAAEKGKHPATPPAPPAGQASHSGASEGPSTSKAGPRAVVGDVDMLDS